MSEHRLLKLLCTCLLLAGGCGGNGEIRRDEEVTFFPTCAYKTGDRWSVPIHGWLYVPEQSTGKRWLVLKLVAASLDVEEADSDSPVFYRRTRLFLVDNMPSRSFSVDLGSHEFTVGQSAKTGHFHSKFKLSQAEVDALLSQRRSKEGAVQFTARTGPGDKRKLTGEIYFPDPQGVSVVSDVDDTIKFTDVTSKSQMLKNTFLKDFRPVPGMAQAYRSWAEAGAQFHYLTASPCQLYPELRAFADEHGFPGGSFQMSMFDWRTGDIWDLVNSPHDMKVEYLTQLLKSYPQRRFVLVGDSGQEDPEIYAEVARRHPQQVAHIFIREVGSGSPGSSRYQSAFKGISPDRCTVFRDPGVLQRYRLPAAQ